LEREYQEAKAINFSFSYYEKGLQIVPTSATITIYDNGGGATLAATAMTVSAAGTLTYTLALASVVKKKNYRVDIAYIYNTVTYNQSYLYDVVSVPLRCQVSDDDLFIYVNELRNNVKELSQRTTALGTTSTLTAYGLTTDKRDYKGGYIDIFIETSDTASVIHKARITAYDTATGTMTFTPAYTAAIASGTTITIRPSFQTIIDTAFNSHVIKDIRNKVGIAGGYIDSTITNNMTIYKALEMYCFAQVESENDKWDVRQKNFRQNYVDELTKLSEPYDRDENGNISDSEDDMRPSFMNIGLTR